MYFRIYDKIVLSSTDDSSELCHVILFSLDVTAYVSEMKPKTLS